MNSLTVIKIGGNIVDNELALHDFLLQFASIKGAKILVHGGGKVATKIGEQLGIVSKYVNGRRITDEATLDLVTMVYGGLINKKIVAILQKLACNAIGLTGADGNLIPAIKRPVKEIDYGYVGDVLNGQIPVKKWVSLIHGKFIPIVAPLTHDNAGHMLNTNADTIAQEIAVALSSDYDVSLIYSFEKEGVLLDVHDEESVIPSITLAYYEELKTVQEDGSTKIFAGMIPKLDNAFQALKHGVQRVIIGKANDVDSLLQGSKGTTIKL